MSTAAGRGWGRRAWECERALVVWDELGGSRRMLGVLGGLQAE